MIAYTVYTDSYIPYWDLLKDSFIKNGVPYIEDRRPDQPTWGDGCMLKPSGLLAAFEDTDEDLLLVDADALVLRPLPEITTPGDIVAYRYQNNHWCGGTILFRKTTATLAMLERWKDKKPCPGDQGPLNEAIEESQVLDGLTVGNLTAQWLCMDGYPEEDVLNPIIRHFMARERTIEKGRGSTTSRPT